MSVVNLNNIKTQIKSILDTANDASATHDLSSSMTTRVQKVLTVSPERIPIQASFFPCVTMFFTDKAIDLTTISANQSNAKRMAKIAINLVGLVFLHKISDPTKDDADNEVELLMENIEEIMRANPELNSTVLWNKPLRTSYHNVRLEEGAFFRTGITTFELQVLY